MSFQSLSRLEISNKQIQMLLDLEKDPLYYYNFLIRVYGLDTNDHEAKIGIDKLSNSSLVNALLYSIQKNISNKKHPYKKWDGVHWCLALLADLHYPIANSLLEKARDYELKWILSPQRSKNIRTINGKTRFCASQEGNALFSIMRLQLDNGTAREIANRLVGFQWEDGGWNCDKKIETKNSSYNESLIPLQGLNEYYLQTHDIGVKRSIEKGTELFLKRHLFKRISDGMISSLPMIELSYPAYWHYNIIDALKVLIEVGCFQDSRVLDALQFLLKKQLSDGGFPAERKYYQCNHETKSLYSSYNWGGVNKKRLNPWVTLTVLSILKKFGLVHLVY